MTLALVHGTVSAYTSKLLRCRCDLCKRAMAAYQRAHRARNPAPTFAVAGGHQHRTRQAVRCADCSETFPIQWDRDPDVGTHPAVNLDRHTRAAHGRSALPAERVPVLAGAGPSSQSLPEITR